MKTLKIYNIVAGIIIIALSIWINALRKELKETKEVLDQCSDRYYQEIQKQ
ncbi:hypothetical protein [Soonwooa purpurea]